MAFTQTMSFKKLATVLLANKWSPKLQLQITVNIAVTKSIVKFLFFSP